MSRQTPHPVVWLLPLAFILWSGPVTAAVAAEPIDVTPAPAPPVPEDADLTRAADLALQGGRLTEAHLLLERIEAQGTADRSTIGLLKAELLLALGRPAEAGLLLATVSEADVPVCRVATAKALASLHAGAVRDAETSLDAKAANCAADPVYWRVIGWVALSLGHRVAAAEAYRRALALDPESDATRNDLAVALIANDQPEEAAGLLASVSAAQPRRHDVSLNLDFANAMMGRNPVRRADESDAFWSRRLETAAEGARRSGRTGFAKALFARALIARPRHDERLWQHHTEPAVAR